MTTPHIKTVPVEVFELETRAGRVAKAEVRRAVGAVNDAWTEFVEEYVVMKMAEIKKVQENGASEAEKMRMQRLKEKLTDYLKRPKAKYIDPQIARSMIEYNWNCLGYEVNIRFTVAT